MVDWELLVPGMGLTILGMAGVGLSLAGIARTFVEGMHAISALMMFIGLIFFAAGILKDGLPTSNTAKATVLIIIGFLVSFGTFMIGMSTVTSLSMFAGILLLILVPTAAIAYAAKKQSPHFKAIAILFSSASVVGAIAFVTFGFVAPQPIEAGVIEKPPAAEELGPRVEVTISPGSGVPGCEAENKCFDPFEITVPVGTTVVWTNKDSQGHTITSGNPGEAEFGKVFDSSFPLLKSEATFEHTFDQAGEFLYFCQVHPYMVGKVIVT